MAAAWVLLVMLWNLAVGRVRSAQPTPIVLWHGMGDCCCNPFRNAIIICFLRDQKSFNKKNKERLTEYYMYELWARTRTTYVV
jgi:hypothetical protein